MNELIQTSGVPTSLTMSTREIAELTGKMHKDVLYDTRKMLAGLEKAAADFSATAQIPGPNGSTRTVEVYNLPKDLTLTLVAGYSVQLRHRIVTRWLELEAAAAPAPATALQLTPRQLAQLVIEAEDAREKAEQEKQRLAIDLSQKSEALALAAPKAEALDRISASEEAVTLTQAAKLLGIKRETLTNYLHANGWVYRQNDAWVAYDRHIKNGRLQFKEARYTDSKTGHECRTKYCHIMPKGLAILAEHFAAKQPQTL